MSPYRATRLIFRAVSLLTLFGDSTRLVGDKLGADEGNSVGALDGRAEDGDAEVGKLLGRNVGNADGFLVGLLDDGRIVGDSDGLLVGDKVGIEGAIVEGTIVGIMDVG
jgi:hypothetical protein